MSWQDTIRKNRIEVVDDLFALLGQLKGMTDLNETILLHMSEKTYATQKAIDELIEKIESLIMDSKQGAESLGQEDIDYETYRRKYG